MREHFRKETLESIKAEIIADSINERTGDRITTFVLEAPRIILAEFNTHRVFSRNSASSRAIPASKMIQRVKDNHFAPLVWMKNHSGIQGDQIFDKTTDKTLRENDWRTAMENQVSWAEVLLEDGLSKQFVNRLLEPFMYHKILVTATEYHNFFKLRAHEAAEIHIQELAYQMLHAYNISEPKVVSPYSMDIRDRHIPFSDHLDFNRIDSIIDRKRELFIKNQVIKDEDQLKIFDIQNTRMEYAFKISTARCARVSYLNFEGKDDYNADLELHDRLAAMGHWSPFEHCASPDLTSTFSGNFKGFIQYRKKFPLENQGHDPRVLDKKYLITI